MKNFLIIFILLSVFIFSIDSFASKKEALVFLKKGMETIKDKYSNVQFDKSGIHSSLLKKGNFMYSKQTFFAGNKYILGSAGDSQAEYISVTVMKGEKLVSESTATNADLPISYCSFNCKVTGTYFVIVKLNETKKGFEKAYVASFTSYLSAI
jgi:hypothetical protein